MRLKGLYSYLSIASTREQKHKPSISLPFNTRWRRAIDFTPQLLYDWGKSLAVQGEVGLRASLDVVVKRRVFEPNSSVIHPVV